MLVDTRVCRCKVECCKTSHINLTALAVLQIASSSLLVMWQFVEHTELDDMEVAALRTNSTLLCLSAKTASCMSIAYLSGTTGRRHALFPMH